MTAAAYSPDYEHVPGQYEAACQWLGLAAKPVPPLPKFLYMNIADDCDFVDKKWAYNPERAARSFAMHASDAGVYLDRGAPSPKGLEFFLKHLFRGMYHAYQVGATEGPKSISFAKPNEEKEFGSGGGPPVALANNHLGQCLCFIRVRQLGEDLENLAELLQMQTQQAILQQRKAGSTYEAIGATIQCHTDFNYRNKQLSKSDIEAFRIKRQEFVNNMMGSIHSRNG